MAEADRATESERVGLCLECRHMRQIATPRGSVFYQCALAATDAAFPKYPRLPVVSCRGFESDAASEESGI